jgi:N-acetylglucosamine-6-phosphate deacetylase
MTQLLALVGATIFDGARRHAGATILIDGATIAAITSAAPPSTAEVVPLDGGLLAPGFIDLQVNGGGGALFNDDPTPDALATIAATHRRCGVTGLLPTLITDTPAVTAAAIDAVARARITSARRDAVPGILGLHLEGPHLWPGRRGAHRPELMRPLTDSDVDRLIDARARIGTLLVTIAVEQATARQIARLAEEGICVSLGHSDASFAEAQRAIDAGARGITHLFNAMAPLLHRAPGLVGAALDSAQVWCGLIADGHHVDPAVLRLALRAKRGPGRMFLVSDAMSTVGATGDRFVLGGRVATRTGGAVRLDDGTLAGADLDLASAVRFAVDHLELPVDEALRMASLYPATLLGERKRGRIAPGTVADLVHLDDALRVQATWIAGERYES